MIFKMTSYLINERNISADPDPASFHMHLFHTNNGLYILDYYTDQVEASCEEMLSWLIDWAVWNLKL